MDSGWLFLIPLLPLCGAIVNAAFGARLQRRFGRHAVSVVAVGVVVAAMGLGIGADGDDAHRVAPEAPLQPRAERGVDDRAAQRHQRDQKEPARVHVTP